MSALTHTPYATGFRPFTIGLSALDPQRWIEPDDGIAAYLEEKQRLAQTRLADVFRATDDSLDAQQECLDLLARHLEQQHPVYYSRSGFDMRVAGQVVNLADEAIPPLMRAGFLVQDDLVIMRKRETGWQITAAHLSFPSSWVLAEKFKRPMEEVHEHVPGFQAGTRNAALVNRIFDNLLPSQPAERFNWSINWKPQLFHPESGRDDTAQPDEAIIRVERQTLTRLPASGDIVFTIRIYLDPVRLFSNHPRGRELAAALAGQLDGLSAEQASYKGLDRQRQKLAHYLHQQAAAQITR